MPQLPLSVFLVSVGTALATRLTKWSNRRSTCPLPCPFRRRDSIKTQRVVGRTVRGFKSYTGKILDGFELLSSQSTDSIEEKSEIDH